ncbi:hypothetical protein BDV23DRAFT_179570 [Aspergillus alliaceus]|uniref:Mok11-13/Ags1-like Ig-like beta-sandwich domain-containing protein n=1 Tax=Petromyces alliaceus TaxID=209559 RepID=A0A5N7CKS1_PETAA|nr:hypothetical protein BDV23DRAFT_179570 [Aspergillus alliaceus]
MPMPSAPTSQYHFTKRRPIITKSTPSHDAPIRSTAAPDLDKSVNIRLYFSDGTDCDYVVTLIFLSSSTKTGKVLTWNEKTVNCNRIPASNTSRTGQLHNIWIWTASLTGVYTGIHRGTVKNVSNVYGNATTNAVDHFLLCIGQIDNPMDSLLELTRPKYPQVSQSAGE